jgi:hypothetical protein
MQIQCCVERTLLEEEETPEKETDTIKLKPIPWYGSNAPLLPPPRIVTTLPRTISNATTIPN